MAKSYTHLTPGGEILHQEGIEGRGFALGDRAEKRGSRPTFEQDLIGVPDFTDSH